jgi:hypothetical protein
MPTTANPRHHVVLSIFAMLCCSLHSFVSLSTVVGQSAVAAPFISSITGCPMSTTDPSLMSCSQPFTLTIRGTNLNPQSSLVNASNTLCYVYTQSGLKTGVGPQSVVERRCLLTIRRDGGGVEVECATQEEWKAEKVMVEELTREETAMARESALEMQVWVTVPDSATLRMCWSASSTVMMMLLRFMYILCWPHSCTTADRGDGGRGRREGWN